MASISLIQGASRGIGLEFCRHLLRKSSDGIVIATCRSPDSASHLKDLQKSHHERLQLCQLDVQNESHIQNVAKYVNEQFGRLDLLVNTAGMLHPSGRGETSLKDVSFEGLKTTFETNTFGPLMMAKYFSPLLIKGSGCFGQQAVEVKNRHAAILVNMSAKVGSITENKLGGWYSYRMSKVALNMATRNLSIELGRGRNRVICVALHPGTVDTDLSRPYNTNIIKLFSAEYSVNCLMAVIDSLKIEDSGQFLTYDRTQMPF
ncbi:hypothetical protein ACJMK2_005603 [Sinanodonta woodiana]|uniref:C-factor n=1 Tax=Sinanodonta woodiana TaxID=1069815 RepID=A0ABD3VRW8_SINWO